MLNEILEKLGLDGMDETLGFKCTVLGKAGVYIEGILKVKQFDSDKILLKVHKGEVEILGKKLHIKSLSRQEVIVSGEIERVVLNA